MLFPCTPSLPTAFPSLFHLSLFFFRDISSSYLHALALWPSSPACTALLLVSHRESSWWWRPLSAHGGITGWFWTQKTALLANVKAVSMCLITFTNPSSGLSGCQCCMIPVEHGLVPLTAGLDPYIWDVSKLFHAVALSVCKATASATWPATTESGHLSLRGSAEGGRVKTSLLLHQLLSRSLFLISQEAPGAAVWNVTDLFLCLYELPSILTHFCLFYQCFAL